MSDQKRRLYTYSEIETFRTCPARHHYRYREQLRPVAASVRMRTGSHYHAGVRVGLLAGFHAAAAGAPVDEAVREAILAGVPEAVRALEQTTAGLLASRDVNSEDAVRLRDEADQVRPVLEWIVAHYFEATADDFGRLVPIAIESAYEVPVARRDGRGGPTWQAGVIDLAFYDREQGDIVIDDHKTVDAAPWSVEKRVEMDPQTAGYIAGVRSLQARGRLAPIVPLTVAQGALASAATGRVRYSVMRRSKPHAPKVNQDGTVSVAAIDTTADVYEAALARQDTPAWLASARAAASVEGGAGPKVIERLRAAEDRWDEIQRKQRDILERLRGKGDPYFARFEFWRSSDEIERWRREFYVDAGRIRAADRDPALRTRSSGACTMPWSPPCEYRAVCMDPDAPEIRDLYRVASEPHEEIARAREDADNGATEVDHAE